MREFIVPLPQSLRKTHRHSREGGNPQFPRMREFNENTIQTDLTPSFPHRTTSTSFPRRRESTFPRMREFIVPLPHAQEKPHCPRKTLRHSREGGNPQFPRMREFNENTIQTDQTPHSHTELPQRHSREGGNPQFLAHAGIHRPLNYPQCAENYTASFPPSRE